MVLSLSDEWFSLQLVCLELYDFHPDGCFSDYKSIPVSHQMRLWLYSAREKHGLFNLLSLSMRKVNLRDSLVT